MSNKVYDRLKWVALIFIPALSVLYATLGHIWDFPYVERIVGTLSAIDVFLGALLQISNSKYKKI